MTNHPREPLDTSAVRGRLEAALAAWEATGRDAGEAAAGARLAAEVAALLASLRGDR